MGRVKEFAVNFFGFLADNMLATTFTLVVLMLVYFLFLANRSVRLDTELLLEKQFKEVEDKRWEFEKRLKHEKLKGFRYAFVLTNMFWGLFVYMGYEYGFDMIANIIPHLASDIEKNKDVKNIKKYKLTVNTIPENSVVKIMNIFPPYKQGMLLEPGHYRIRVKAAGYCTENRRLEIKDKDEIISITLKKITDCCGTYCYK